MEKKSKRPRQRRADAEKLERKMMMQVDVDVWRIIHQSKSKAKAETAEELLSRDYKTESERISKNSRKYQTATIAEAFEREYGVTLSEQTKQLADFVPPELTLGQVIELKIDSITKNGVLFDSCGHKGSFATRNNLNRYQKFQEFLPTKPLPAKIVEVRSDVVMVDLFSPMVEQFVLPYAKAPWMQYKLENYQPIKVKNLHLVRGGFLGQAVIPNVSNFVGEDYTIEAFIPGSQIVQNTTDDFEQFEGTDVEAFIIAYSPKPYNQGMSLVCSVKNLIKHRGNLRMMQLHKTWCDNEEDWNKVTDMKFEGVVTGIINSSQKCGVFVEVPELEITGMVNISADRLSEYHPGDNIEISIEGFDEKMVYNEAVNQMQHAAPFEIVDGALKTVNVKPVLKLA